MENKLQLVITEHSFHDIGVLLKIDIGRGIIRKKVVRLPDGTFTLSEEHDNDLGNHKIYDTFEELQKDDNIEKIIIFPSHETLRDYLRYGVYEN